MASTCGDFKLFWFGFHLILCWRSACHFFMCSVIWIPNLVELYEYLGRNCLFIPFSESEELPYSVLISQLFPCEPWMDCTGVSPKLVLQCWLVGFLHKCDSWLYYYVSSTLVALSEWKGDGLPGIPSKQEREPSVITTNLYFFNLCSLVMQ